MLLLFCGENMQQKDLSKLSRLDLLELLIEQSKEVERLNNEMMEMKEQLENREIAVDRAGTLAEASLELSGIFDAAQKAADKYLENVRLMEEKNIKTYGDE